MKKKVHLLIIRLSAMGDVAMSVPVLKLLLEQNPHLEISVVSRPKFEALFNVLPRCKFIVADVDSKHKGLKGIWKLSNTICASKPDFIADIHEVLRTNILDLILKLRLRKPIVKIDKGRYEKKKLCANIPHKNLYPLKTTFERYADVFRKLGFVLNLDATYNPPSPKGSLIAEKLLNGSEKVVYVGIAAFARYQSKTYPTELMEKLIDLLIGKSKIIHLFLFGGTDDFVQMNLWKKKYPDRIFIASTELNFEDELYLISKMKLMLSMDSANMHLASIFSVPVISLWGPTHPFLGFYGWRQASENLITADFNIYPSLPCSVNGKKVHPGTENCMSSIPPNVILDKIVDVLKNINTHF